MDAFANRDLSSYAQPDAVIASGFARALEAARAFEGATAPNPPVGCVLLDGAGDIITIGAHKRAGTYHAEASAIAQAEAAGWLDAVCSVLVTLEPCNHTGRTPPCAEAILKTPAKHVWIGTMDPNPQVAGGGAARLRAAGLNVHEISELAEVGAGLSQDAARLVAPFVHHAQTGLPYVTIKQAINRAGTMVPPAGQTTFTSQLSLKQAHVMRRRAGAIITGSGTIIADNPSFTVRHVPDFEHVQRQLIILDRRQRVSQDYLDAARQRGFLVAVESSIDAALARLGADGVMEVLVEAGPSLTQAFLDRGLWQEHVRFEQQQEGQPDVVCKRYRDAQGQIEE